MNNHYIYPIVVEKGEDGGIGMYFPDFEGTAVLADDLVDGVKRAKEVLVGRMLELEEKGEAAPVPSDVDSVPDLDPNDRIIFIEVYMPPYRDEAANKSVTKNCTLPKWLRDAGDAAGLNYSLILQNGLKEALGLTQDK